VNRGLTEQRRSDMFERFRGHMVPHLYGSPCSASSVVLSETPRSGGCRRGLWQQIERASHEL